MAPSQEEARGIKVRIFLARKFSMEVLFLLTQLEMKESGTSESHPE